ncbi:unnamed protein product [Caenorhabditis bovis]|uniref:Uncharacterized protein n=1 Tax=Caenorhabditis bovis TaxID=2654633 RepID=A0A8S1F2J9_9PELO|nr:unnamed protein product [Caenorhabditis bovis]
MNEHQSDASESISSEENIDLDNVSSDEASRLDNGNPLGEKVRATNLQLLMDITEKQIKQLDELLNTAQFDDDILNPTRFMNFRRRRDRGKQFYRGHMRYIRPCGSERHAIRLEGRYRDGDEWLKMNGNRDEWPVAYIGTKLTSRLADCAEFNDNEIVFCTPDPQIALKYSEVKCVYVIAII